MQSKYKKIIRYGNNLETYEYSREPQLVARRKRIRPQHDGDNGLGIDREDHLSSERRLAQRRNNAWRAMVAFRRLVISNLSGDENPVLVTITYKENQTDIRVGYKNFRSFNQALRNKFGKNFRYISAPEFQTRGAVHFHSLFWGLPAEIFLQERETRTLMNMWGHGFVYYKFTDGHEKLSTYLSKYMSKAFIDPRLENQKAYVASRNILRPEIVRGTFPLWPIIDDFEEGKESIVIERSYETKYLGTCRHRLFKTK